MVVAHEVQLPRAEGVRIDADPAPEFLRFRKQRFDSIHHGGFGGEKH